MDVNLDIEELFYDKYEYCKRYLVLITTLSYNITKYFEFTYTGFLPEIIPENVTYNKEEKTLKWKYESFDCLPRTFYVLLIVID